MTKKSLLERQKKRKILVTKFLKNRQTILKNLKKSISFFEFLNLQKKLQKLPRDSAKNRLKNRCWKTGRARGFFKYFGLCRNAIRELSHECLLPGVIKASW